MRLFLLFMKSIYAPPNDEDMLNLSPRALAKLKSSKGLFRLPLVWDTAYPWREKNAPMLRVGSNVKSALEWFLRVGDNVNGNFYDINNIINNRILLTIILDLQKGPTTSLLSYYYHIINLQADQCSYNICTFIS